MHKFTHVNVLAERSSIVDKCKPDSVRNVADGVLTSNICPTVVICGQYPGSKKAQEETWADSQRVDGTLWLAVFDTVTLTATVRAAARVATRSLLHNPTLIVRGEFSSTRPSKQRSTLASRLISTPLRDLRAAEAPAV